MKARVEHAEGPEGRLRVRTFDESNRPCASVYGDRMIYDRSDRTIAVTDGGRYVGILGTIRTCTRGPGIMISRGATEHQISMTASEAIY